jgi:hypothetical protein
VPFPHLANHIFRAFITLAEQKEKERTLFVLITRKLQKDKWEEGLKIRLYDHRLVQLFIIPRYPEEMNTAQTRALRA